MVLVLVTPECISKRKGYTATAEAGHFSGKSPGNRKATGAAPLHNQQTPGPAYDAGHTAYV